MQAGAGRVGERMISGDPAPRQINSGGKIISGRKMTGCFGIRADRRRPRGEDLGRPGGGAAVPGAAPVFSAETSTTPPGAATVGGATPDPAATDARGPMPRR